MDLFDLNDIVLADLGARQIAPVTLAAGAHNLFYPDRSRRQIVYTTDADPAAPGLYVVRAH